MPVQPSPCKLVAAVGGALPVALLGLIAAVFLSGCSGSSEGTSAGGSTLQATLVDTDGDGLPEAGPGEHLLTRTEVAPEAPLGAEIARLGVLNDLHVRDEESPARVPFLDRLGAPFTSTFRPQEALSAHVLAAAVEALRAQRPTSGVLVAGDLADNAQRNELAWAAGVLNGERVDPDSGAPGYDGVQRAANPDPFYYRPGVDPPRKPALLSAAQQPLSPRGLEAPWFPIMGNHDLLVQGELAPTPRVQAIATGDEGVERLDSERLERLDSERLERLDPERLDVPRDSALAPQVVDRLLGDGTLPGRTRSVPTDRDRGLVSPLQAADLLRTGASASGSRLRNRAGAPQRLDYTADLGPRVRLIALDLVDRSGGSRGVVTPEQRAWLAEQLEAARERWVIVAAHQPLDSSLGGREALALLAAHPHMLALVHGHTHANEVTPRNGYWVISTASLTDWPLQGRMLSVRETATGGAAIETWIVDVEGGGLAGDARELAHLDAQGGRPAGDRGGRRDRNVRLFVGGG